MHGMFRANGGCGYIKKPDFLMSRGPNDYVFDPKSFLPARTTLQVSTHRNIVYIFCILKDCVVE